MDEYNLNDAMIDIRDSVFYLKNAFKALYQHHEYHKADLAFVAVDALEIVLMDMEEELEKPKMNHDEEIKKMLANAKKSLDKACLLYDKTHK